MHYDRFKEKDGNVFEMRVIKTEKKFCNSDNEIFLQRLMNAISIEVWKSQVNCSL